MYSMVNSTVRSGSNGNAVFVEKGFRVMVEEQPKDSLEQWHLIIFPINFIQNLSIFIFNKIHNSVSLINIFNFVCTALFLSRWLKLADQTNK